MRAPPFVPDELLAPEPPDLTGEDTRPRAVHPAIGPRLHPEHPLSKVAAKTGLDEARLRGFVEALERKGQAVLVGPPGSGKSLLAAELARHVIGHGDGFVTTLQLHASWSYEDFVQGYRPETRPDGSVYYPLRRGRFYRFCDEARKRRDRCVLVLEEMHRADLPRLFGELVHLLEHRGEAMLLAQGDVPFELPPNVRVLGTMSATAAPSVDAVLRRRFAFLPVPADREVLRRALGGTGVDADALLDVLVRIDDALADPKRALGHAYFLRDDLAATLEAVWRFEVEPALEGLFLDRPERVAAFRWDVVRRELAGCR